MQRLDDLIGKKVSIAILNSKEPAYAVTLHGVEAGGIWIECKEYEELLGYKKPRKPKNLIYAKPVFFIPYAQIQFLISYSTELDEDTLRGS